MEKNFKFSAEEKNLLKDSLSQFKNDVLKDSVTRIGGMDADGYSRGGTYTKNDHSRDAVIIGVIG